MYSAIYGSHILIALCSENPDGGYCLTDYTTEVAQAAANQAIGGEELPQAGSDALNAVLPKEYFCTDCGAPLLNAERKGAGMKELIGEEDSELISFVDESVQYVNDNCPGKLEDAPNADIAGAESIGFSVVLVLAGLFVGLL